MSSAYHPQSDGSMERANRTVTQMIWNCVSLDQKDWVARLPGIEYAINMACSDSTGYSLFFLNMGRTPSSMLWDSPTDKNYPGVKNFALCVKTAIMSAHDSILASCVKQTRDANKHHCEAPFAQDDLLVPKFVGPYKIVRDFGNNSYQIDLPSELKQWGLHPVFHASLLCAHVPNDDRLFPGRLHSQVGLTAEPDNEWKIKGIVAHKGKGRDTIFKVEWATGDKTWVPYGDALNYKAALQDYLDILGVKSMSQLPMSQIENKDKGMEMFIGSLTADLVRLGQRNKVKGWDIPEISPRFPPQHSGLSHTCSLSRGHSSLSCLNPHHSLDKPAMAPEVIINIGTYNFDAMKASPLQLTIQDLVDSNDVVLDRSQVLCCCVLAEMVKKKAGAVPTDQPMPLGYEYLAFPYIDETTGHWKVPSKIIKINDLLPVVPMQKVKPLSAIERAELEELKEWELLENRRRREREKKIQKRKMNLNLTKKFDKQQAKDVRAINHAFCGVRPLKTSLCSHAGPSHSSPIPMPSSSTTTSFSTTPSTSSIHKPTLSAAMKPFMPQSMAPDVAMSSSALSSSNLASLKFHKKDGALKGPKGTAQPMDVDDPEEDGLLNYKDDA
ncbi:uncharacterized protein ARMOST_12941 [Armillaria ostoyae]|uniref:Tf2-1-like SH3-like domain-containing protein n=1 Tax=Armillaria ostoyae TaxID=47428 RepID=A0A284RLD0_ARMOS|nr:uncharacterized protein ARMOST_12941 [Armillaria ostoyae]